MRVTSFSKKSSDVAGECIPNQKLILINQDEFDMDVIIHEICHAFLSYQAINDVVFDGSNMEEFLCEFNVKYMNDIKKLSDKAYDQLK